MPSFDEELNLGNLGFRHIAGIDEAGRGALAGPVVAAAVILPRKDRIPFLHRIKDSKKLTPRQRNGLFDEIRGVAVAAGVGIVYFDIIDRTGIAGATRLAMKKAVENLSPPADYLLIDYMKLPDVPLPQKGIVHGDDLCYSIAAASIIAKVTRDRIMVELDDTYRGYGLASHKGYGTGEHLACLRQLGPSPVHRRSFNPVCRLRFGDYR
jgi:ribonuclease HII